MITPNYITLGRIALVIGVIVLFRLDFWASLLGVVLTPIVFWLDSFDGWWARRHNMASDFGALFDITGDRIVEHIYLIFFAAVHAITFWIAIIFITRSFLIDTLRSFAYSDTGKTPFGAKTMMTHPITRFLTSSRLSRATYGAAKVTVFVLLGFFIAAAKPDSPIKERLAQDWLIYLRNFTMVLLWLMVALNVIRGVPVLWEGRDHLFKRVFNKSESL